MLTKRQIHDDIRRRAWAAFPYAAIGICMVFAYIPIVSLLFDPPPASMEAFLFIILAFPVFLAPILIGNRKAQRIKTLCPTCHQELNNKLRRLLRTRLCPSCNEHIVEGYPRSEKALARHRQHIQYLQARNIHWALWFLLLPPVVSVVADAFNPKAVNPAIAFSCLMLLASTYLWIRTRNHRCAVPLLVSLILFSISACRFWIHAGTP